MGVARTVLLAVILPLVAWVSSNSHRLGAPPFLKRGQDGGSCPVLYYVRWDDPSISRLELSPTQAPERLLTALIPGLLPGLAVLEAEGGISLYWPTGWGIQRAELSDGVASVRTLLSGLRFPRDVQVDLRGSWMYWLESQEIGPQLLRRARLDGSQAETLLEAGHGADSLIRDPQTGDLYWILEDPPRSREHKIVRWNPQDVEIREVLTGLREPGELVVDPVRRKLYWTEEGERIRAASWDGSEVRTLLRGLSWPHGLALDPEGGKLYWITEDGTVQRTSLDEPQVEDWLRPDQPWVDLAVSEGWLYAKTHSGVIQRVPLNAPTGMGTGEEPIETVLFGMVEPQSLQVDPVRRQIYWADTGRLKTVDLEGQNGTFLLSRSQEEELAVWTLALDVESGALYIGDASQYKIRRITLNDGKVEEVVDTQPFFTGPRRLALDPETQTIYWAGGESLLRASVNDGNPEIFYRGDPNARVEGLAVDPVRGWIYWSERVFEQRPGRPSEGRILRADRERPPLAGGEVEVLFEGLPEPGSLAVDPYRGVLYWADRKTREVRRVGLDGDGTPPEVVLEGALVESLALLCAGR